MAKVLLAYAPPEILDEVLANGVTPVTAATPDETELRRDLEDDPSAPASGRSEGEVISGSVTIAVPILRDDGIVAAIGVVCPVGRASLAWRTRVARLLQDAARTVAGSHRHVTLDFRTTGAATLTI